MTSPATTEVAEPTVAAIIAAPLTLVDRCDRCNAQAFVKVTVMSSTDGKGVDLMFCGHHYAKYEPALRDRVTVLTVQDERSRINEKPSQSSV